mmetsp:Transcript_3481/g.5429  ORF Transcript_3481/g.5429 Transcript_3481/m.5429 type:complete len:346 (+) Transcript_3481:30-1067(+)
MKFCGAVFRVLLTGSLLLAPATCDACSPCLNLKWLFVLGLDSGTISNVTGVISLIPGIRIAEGMEGGLNAAYSLFEAAVGTNFNALNNKFSPWRHGVISPMSLRCKILTTLKLLAGEHSFDSDVVVTVIENRLISLEEFNMHINVLFPCAKFVISYPKDSVLLAPSVPFDEDHSLLYNRQQKKTLTKLTSDKIPSRRKSTVFELDPNNLSISNINRLRYFLGVKECSFIGANSTKHATTETNTSISLGDTYRYPTFAGLFDLATGATSAITLKGQCRWDKQYGSLVGAPKQYDNGIATKPRVGGRSAPKPTVSAAAVRKPSSAAVAGVKKKVAKGRKAPPKPAHY